MIEKRDILASGSSDSFIVRSRLVSDILGKVDERDPRITERRDNSLTVIGARVPDDEQLPVLAGLRDTLGWSSARHCCGCTSL